MLNQNFLNAKHLYMGTQKMRFCGTLMMLKASAKCEDENMM